MKKVISFIKSAKDKKSYGKLGIDEYVNNLRNGHYLQYISHLRDEYPVLIGCREQGLRQLKMIMSIIPTVCFSSLQKKQKGMVTVKDFNWLVTLHVNNIDGHEDAIEVRNQAAALPYTTLSFIGATGFDVVIVCKIKPANNEEADGEADMQTFLLNGYRKLHYLYSSQLGVSIDNTEPSLMSDVMVSADKDTYFNPDSEPYFVSKASTEMPLANSNCHIAENGVIDGLLSMDSIFEWCLNDAMDKARKMVENQEDLNKATLSLLAGFCQDSGLPIDFAIKHTSWKPMFFTLEENYINEVFNTAYGNTLRKCIPLGHINKSTLLTYKTEAFMNMHYQLRRNTLTGNVQYRKRDGYDYEFHELTESVLNSMTNHALKAGIESWDKDMRRIVNSDEIPEFNPLADYLSKLPKWDGHDHIADFINRIPTRFSNFGAYFHKWMLSMVAQWQGRNHTHGNALVPLLIGGQGCGKSTICSLILPPELRCYYNDRVEFKNETALMLGLSNFALINIDEFDSVKKSQQPTLKYILSKSDVKQRQPFGTSFKNRPRYASFIATTNKTRPLTDPTGSRRFICIEITEGQRIDFTTPINYEQLFAQLKHEVSDNKRYWLNNEETQLLMQHNESYQKVTDLAVMLDSVVKRPRKGERSQELCVAEIIELIMKKFPDYERTTNTNILIGKLLNQREFDMHRGKLRKYLVHTID